MRVHDMAISIDVVIFLAEPKTFLESFNSKTTLKDMDSFSSTVMYNKLFRTL